MVAIAPPRAFSSRRSSSGIGSNAWAKSTRKRLGYLLLLVPRQRNRRGVAAAGENWFSMQAVRPLSVCHQNTVTITGSGVNGCLSRLRRFEVDSEITVDSSRLATAAEPSTVRCTVKVVFPQPIKASLARNLLRSAHLTVARITEELPEYWPELKDGLPTDQQDHA